MNSITRKLGNGRFGSVYLYENPEKQPSQIVYKFSKGEASYALKHEAYIYQMLRRFDTEGFPGLSRFFSNIKEKGQQNR